MKTRHYCTYFDRNYLPRAVAMHASLRRHGGDFCIDALCLDEESHRLVSALGYPELRPFRLADIEATDSELPEARKNRTWVEYLWTLTPSIVLYCLQRHPLAELMTYIDADLLFFASPEPVFEEMGDASISLIPHRYARDVVRNIHFNGIYNVAMMGFRRDDRAAVALNWWRERCLEACHVTMKDGKFGDQKYLDDWPERFAGVRVIGHKGANVAPWNLAQYDVMETGDGLLIDGQPLIFYHFHKLQILGKKWFHCGVRGISRRNARLIYRPYLHALQEAYARLRTIEPGFEAGFSRVDAPAVWRWLRYRRFHFIRQAPIR
jgi:hypothetical protein